MKLVVKKKCLQALTAMDEEIRVLTNRKIEVFLKSIGKEYDPRELAMILDWPLIAISVPQRSLALQLNKLLANCPNVIFVVEELDELFTVKQGFKKRRVRKDR
jgi:hypothetical protein